MTEPTARDRLRVVRRRLFTLRALQGRDRVRHALIPVTQAAIAAGAAWAFSRHVLGHQTPFFAPIAAWICLGFSPERELRRVAELAIGVALGIGFGDLVAHGIGSGAWQIAVTVFAAALLARFLDRGQMLTMQAGVQSIVIIGMPQITAGPMGRWADALVGGTIAFLIATLTPGDPRRHARALAAESLSAVSEMMRLLARGLRVTDRGDLVEALQRGRAAEGPVADWLTSARSGLANSRLDAASFRFRHDFTRLQQQAVMVDRALRSLRVLARRAAAVQPEGRDLTPVSDVVGQTAQAVQVLAGAVLADDDLTPAREQLLAAAKLADPGHVGVGDWQVQSLVMLMRSPIVDLLEAAGASEAEARAALPEL